MHCPFDMLQPPLPRKGSRHIPYFERDGSASAFAWHASINSNILLTDSELVAAALLALVVHVKHPWIPDRPAYICGKYLQLPDSEDRVGENPPPIRTKSKTFYFYSPIFIPFYLEVPTLIRAFGFLGFSGLSSRSNPCSAGAHPHS